MLSAALVGTYLFLDAGEVGWTAGQDLTTAVVAATTGAIVSSSPGPAPQRPSIDPAAGRDTPAENATRLWRHFDWRSGMPVSFVNNMVQDRTGFIWIGTPGGLVRFDGAEMRLWSRLPATIVTGPASTSALYVDLGENRFGRVVPDGIEVLPRPSGASGEASWAALSGDDVLWVPWGGRIYRLKEGTAWEALPPAYSPPDPVRLVIPGRDTHVLAGTGDALWRLDGSSPAVRVATIRGAGKSLETRDGRLIVSVNSRATGWIYEVRDGTAVLLHQRRPGRVIDLIERGDSIWIAYDSGLVELRDGKERNRIDVSESLPSGGGMLVDREGCLWIGTFRGLVQFPVPEVAATAKIGVARYIARSRKHVWVTFWGRVIAQEADTFPFAAPEIQYDGYQAVCVDAADHAWTTLGGRWTEFPPEGPSVTHAAEAPPEQATCTAGRAGRRWIPAHASLWVVDGDGRPPHQVPSPRSESFEGGELSISAVVETGDGALWAAGGTVACQAPVDAVLSGRQVTWSCETLVPPPAEITSVAWLPSGSLWATVHRFGVLTRRGGAWVRPPISDRLASRSIDRIAPSPAGGLWISGQGFLVRMEERAQSAEGDAIVEDLSAWQGIPARDGVGVEEDEDGTLWIGTTAGLMSIPPGVRRARPEPPAVVVVDAQVDGRPLTLDKPIELPYRRNRLEARIAALSYRDPGAIRYRHRLRPADPWSPPTAHPVFRFPNLSPGRYALEVQASLDGIRWSESAARLEFRVGTPWYLSPWFFAALAAASGLGAWGVFRVRLAYLLRLERQRTRIAMDLHDEIGSGLGSIGVLSGLLARRKSAAADEGEFAARIAAISKELSLALGDIVWSLRPTSGTLDALMAQILERGRPLFADDRFQFVMDAPEPVPAVSLTLAVRRNVFLIALEALHNASRHAGATRITVRLASAEGRQWRLTVEDDGVGLPPAASGMRRRRGLGLEGMQRRAEEIVALLGRDAIEGGGTRVSVVFDPRAEGRRGMRGAP